MTARLNALQERILLELSGRGERVSVRDLCDSIGIDPGRFASARTRLYLADMISYHPNLDEHKNPSYAITWIGEDWLAKRPKPSVGSRPRRRWFGLVRRVSSGSPR
jgi:hypothetical protein